MGTLAVKLLVTYTLYSAIFTCSESSMNLNNEGDGSALLAFKAQITQDPHNVLSSWNDSIHFCQWHGVNCSRRHRQRVTQLNLQSLNLTGSLSPHIGNLSFLRELRLQNNSFSHEIPSEITHLQRLEVLLLNNNSFSGHIPHNISHCFNLNFLNLGHNMLVGRIPTEIGSLSKLQIFGLHYNDLTGEIPISMGNLSSLEAFSFVANNFSGSIPSSLGQLRKLTFLGLAMNNLSGAIPPSIYNLSSLLTFSMPFNRIHGSFPENLGNALPNLEIFNINQNLFSGPIPLSVSNTTSVWRFDIGGNQLTGQVPNLQALHNLQEFIIQINHLGSGKDGDLSFLSDLTNATGLRRLIMSYNNFGGTLPTSISNLSTNLEMFWVHTNQLYGSIPAGIGNLNSLGSLLMLSNRFKGSIPAEIGKLTSLDRLDLSNCELSGGIPSSLGNLTKLSRLELQANSLEGSIPSSLGGCRGLQSLYLFDNNLNGTITKEVFLLPSLSISLDLSNNQFTGSLPLEVGNLNILTELDVSDNKLSGPVPDSLGSCESLEVLHLQGNFFNGGIPSSIASLRGIRDIDLSRNNLSGEIPKFLEGFVMLENLNLSFNDFWGSVPIGGVFENASLTSVVGNTKLCGGTANLHLSKCKFKQSHRLKLIIPLVLGLAVLGVAILLAYFFLCWSRKKTKTKDTVNTLGNSLLQVSYVTLLQATDGFSSSNLIGGGSFGSVYKGVLDGDGGSQNVAVKVFNMLRHGASKSFLAECEALRNIRHRNLVKIITVCSSVDFHGNDFKALVYQLMPNGSLEEWLHPSIGKEVVTDQIPKSLSLVQKLHIAIDAACALDYLHNDCETPIVHCDLKPSNVLLDNEFTGHVSDFGLARFLSNVSENHETSSIGVRGTVGYAPPEYGMGSEVSTSGDVYSFGILLLEMFTGKRPTDDMFSGDLNLHNYVEMVMPEPDRATEIADSRLVQGDTEETADQFNARIRKLQVCLSSIFRMGNACSAEAPSDRLKNISDAASELRSIRSILLG